MPNHNAMDDCESWLKFAKDDLSGAKHLLKGEFFSLTTYHCQQAAEKALKGYLVFKNQHISKTHDLTKLIELCRQFDGDFGRLYDEAKLLNPFATKFRYPTEFDIPDFTDAKSAIQQAQKIVTFVVKKVSQPETGQTRLF